MLHVFPTSRAVRNFYNSFRDENIILEKAITIQEFYNKCLYVKNSNEANEELRLVLMLQASKNIAKGLNIPSEFFSFLKNNEYLFRFYEELRAEQCSIGDLKLVDTYEEYSEHLEILENVLENYEKLLKEHKLYDFISLPKQYSINENYINCLDKIYIYQEGIFSKFELEVLEKIAFLKPVFIQLNINKYNLKQKKELERLNIHIQEYGKFVINLSDKSVKKLEAEKIQPNIQVKPFSLRSIQVGYILNEITNLIAQNIDPEQIAIILPDESFLLYLQEYNINNILNFAPGLDIKSRIWVQKLQAIWEFLQENSKENQSRLERLEISKEVLENFITKCNTNPNLEEFKEIIKDFLPSNNEELIKIEQIFLRLETFFSFGLSLEFKAIFRLFLNAVLDMKIDDVRGGKVTVMGLLESRFCEFEAVIIVDFNDEFIPKRSQKDMFLSSAVREFASLPTLNDRENLQRFFYSNIINKAKEVRLSYLQNEESMPSNFLKELSYKESEIPEQSYIKLIFDENPSKNIYEEKILNEQHNFFKLPLSATRLRAYITCPRCYYFKYIKNYNIYDENINQSIGKILHDALYKHYKNNESFNDILTNLTSNKSNQIMLEKDIWQEKLQKFFMLDKQRLKSGYKIAHLEKKIETDFEGIKIKGIIDRIDIKDGKAFVLDYKSGNISLTKAEKVKENGNFQLTFYYILAKSLGLDVQSCAYVDLENGKIIEESVYVDELREVILELKEKKNFEFESKNDRYCYEILCKKEY